MPAKQIQGSILEGYTVTSLVRILGMTRPMVHRYTDQLVPATNGREGPQYKIADVVRVMRQEQKSASPYANAGERKLKAQADRLEMDAAVARGELVSLPAIRDVFGDMISVIRTRLLALPTRTAPLLSSVATTQEIEVILTKAINEVISELRKYAVEDRRATIEGSSNGGASGPAQANRKGRRQRVGGHEAHPIS